MELKKSDLITLIENIVNKTNNKIYDELHQINKNINGSLVQNEKDIQLIESEVKHLKESCIKYAGDMEYIKNDLRDLKSITIGADGSNGLRSKIKTLETDIDEFQCNQEHQGNELKKDINGLKYWKAKIIGISIGVSLIGSIITSMYIKYQVDKMTEFYNIKHIQEERKNN